MVRAAGHVAKELGISNAEFRVLDAERIELDDASVDGILCRYSYMLMGEPLQALRETRRVLRPGGRVAFSTWGEPGRNPWMTLSAGLMIERGLIEPFSSDAPGMFAMPDAETITPLLTEPGFGKVEVAQMEVSWRFDNSDQLWIFTSELQGPIALAIENLDDKQRRAVRAAIEERASQFATDGG